MGTIMKTDSDNYNDIANAIREKSSSSDTYLPSEMGDAIRAIPQEGGGIGEDVITNEYDNTSTYSEGDYVMYNNELYICNTDIDTPENFDNTKWDKTNILSITPEFSVDENGTISTKKGQTISSDTVINFAKGIVIKDENGLNQCYDFRNVYFAELIPRPNDQQHPFVIVFPNYRMMGSAFSEGEEHPSIIFCYQQGGSQNPFVTIPKGRFLPYTGYQKEDSTIITAGAINEINSYCSFDLGNLSEPGMSFIEYAVLMYNDAAPGTWTIHPFSNRSKVSVYDNTTSGLTATNTQDAIDEIVSTIGDVESLLSNI